jgi:hypothetical protein
MANPINPNPVALPALLVPPLRRNLTTPKYYGDKPTNTEIDAAGGIQHLTPAQQEQAYQRLSQIYSKQG